jgi:uncharacterized protein (TIGR04255 family)
MTTQRRYPNPPITEVAVTVQFSPLLIDLTVLDCAKLYKAFSARYPMFNQLLPAGQMPLNPSQAAEMAPMGMPIPRLQFSTESGDQSVLFQADRMTFIWTRKSLLEEDAGYPLFPEILEIFFKELQIVRTWIRKTTLVEVAPLVAEVAYNNGFKMRLGEHKRSLSDVFTFFRNPQKAPMRTFSFSWAEVLDSDKPNDGMITVAASPSMSADGVLIATLALTGTYSVKEMDWAALAVPFQFIHDRLAETFDRIVEAKALQKAPL